MFSLQARGYLMSLPVKPTVAWSKLYSSADARGLCLLLFMALHGFMNIVISVAISACSTAISSGTFAAFNNSVNSTD